MLGNIGHQIERLRARRDNLAKSGGGDATGKLLVFYTRIMTKVTESERCSVFINDPSKNLVWLKAGTGVDERDIEVPKEGSVVGRVIMTGEPVIESGLDKKNGAHKLVEEKTGFITRSILCVPIKGMGGRKVTGAFQLVNKVGDGDFTQEDLSLAQEIAGHLQMEVESIFLGQETFGAVESLYAAAKKTIAVLVFLLVAALLLIGLTLLVYILAPSLFG